MIISISSTINEVKSGFAYMIGISTKEAYFAAIKTSLLSEGSKSSIAETPNKEAG